MYHALLEKYFDFVLLIRAVFSEAFSVNEMRQHSLTTKMFTEQTTLAATAS